MKALILAGGRGKRLGKLSQEKNKCMLEVAGKPLLKYSLDCAVKNDVSEIVIVVGYKKEEVMNIFGFEYEEKKIKYVIQENQKGLVDAIECAKEVIGKEDFILLLGDELMIMPKHSGMIKKYYNENLFAICGVLWVKDESLIKKTYAIQEKDGRIIDLIEKPEIERIKESGIIMRNVMGTGNCIFSYEIFDYISKTPINQKRGERELPDLIKCAINDGKVVKYFFICDKYFNFNIQEEITEADSYFFHLS